MSTDELVALIESEGKVKFGERSMKGRRWNEIFSQESIDRYKKLLGSDKDTEGMLLNVHAIHGAWPTNAGILMFGLRISDHIPQALVRCAAYSGSEKVDILDMKDFDDDLISNIENAIVFLKRHLNESRRVEGIEGKTELEIPEEVLREAVVNSLLHRDYLMTGANVMIEVFFDRVVISSPGGLPKGLDPSDFGSRSVARNPILAEMLLRTPYIEKLGTGVPRMKRSLADAGLAEPVFKFTNFVTVEISRVGYPKEETGQTSGQVKVTDNQWDMILLKMSGQVSGQVKARMFRILKALLSEHLKANQIGEILDEPVATLRRDIKMLRDWNVITFKGSPKTGGYSLSDEVLLMLMRKKTEVLRG